ncbi:MAG: TIGR03545 family protein [Nitrospirota bacterium]|nr:TIGR03545 family protein [Nitrospirota bacterium]
MSFAATLNRWVRWRGLIAFVAVTALLLAVWTLFLDGWVKSAIEAAGTAVVGAKVEVRKVDVSLSPLGMDISGLAVTDPDAPMTNVVEIGSATLALEGGPALLRKVVVSDAHITGVRLHTPRRTSGAVKKAPPPPPQDKADGGLGLDIPMPSVADVLGNGKLAAETVAEGVKTDVETFRSRWDARIKALPNDKAIEDYRRRAKAIRELPRTVPGIAQAAKDIKTLKRDIDRDAAAMREARKALESDQAALRNKLREVRNSPTAEAKRLVAGHGVNLGSAGGVAGTLFGAEAGRWVGTGNQWYHRLAPLLESPDTGAESPPPPVRARGQDIRFPDRHPLPDFLLRKARVQVMLEHGEMNGTLQDVTSDPRLWGRPTTFSLAGDQLKNMRRVALTGKFDHVAPAATRDEITFTVDGYRQDNLPLLRGRALPLVMESGKVNLAVRTAVLGGKGLTPNIDGTINAALSDMRLKVAREGIDPAVTTALTGVTSTAVKVGLSGPLEFPKMRVDTDLDNVLKSVARHAAEAKLAELEGRVRAEIARRVEQQLADVEARLQGHQKELVDQLTSRIQGFDQLQAGLKGL